MIISTIVVYFLLLFMGLGLNIFFLPADKLKYRYLLAPWIATSFIIFIGISLSSSKIAMENSLLSNVTLKGYQFICLFGIFLLISAAFIKWKFIFSKNINLPYLAGFFLLLFLLSKFEIFKIDKEIIKWAGYYSQETIVGFLGKSLNPALLNKNISEPILISFWKAVLNINYLQTFDYMKIIYFSFLLAPAYILFDQINKLSLKAKYISIITLFIVMFIFRNTLFNLNIIVSSGLLLSGVCIGIFLIKSVNNYRIRGLSILLALILFVLFTMNPIGFVILSAFLLIIILSDNSDEKKFLAFNYLVAYLIMILMNPLIIGLTLLHP